MKRAVLAVVLSFWPTPMGLGYLVLGQWARFFIAAVFVQMVASTFVRLIFGHDVKAVFLVVAFAVTIYDCLRLARARLREA